MASATDPIKARLVAVVCGGRGADGLLGPDAARCAIPVGRFRKGLRNTPLRDAAYPQSAFDRATRWTWLSDVDETDPNNDVDALSAQCFLLRLEVGYLCGLGLESYVKLAPGEDAAAALLDPEARAINDALRIRRALGWQQLVQGSIDPAITVVQRQGPTTTEVLGPSRMVSFTTYAVWADLDNASNYDW